MAIGEICTREVVVAKRDITVKNAAQLMREYHVGCIVLVDEQDGKRRPCGIVTDRDIVVAVTALGLDPEVIRAGDVAAKELVELNESAGVAETVAVMLDNNVRTEIVLKNITGGTRRKPNIGVNYCITFWRPPGI